MENTLINKSIHSRYLIANEQDLLWGLTINTIGRQLIKENENYPPRDHPTRYLFTPDKGRVLNEYQLVYITQGAGTFTSTSQRLVEIKAGSMFLLFPNEWHNYAPHPEVGWEEFWIGFKGENIDNRIKSGFFQKNKPFFHVGIQDEIVQLYQDGIRVAKEQNAGYQQLLAGIVNYLLGLAYSKDKHLSFEDLKVTNQINKAKIILAENFQKEIKLEDVAEQINMSYSWFRRLFKEYSGFAPSQYIQELRIQASKELLTNTLFAIKEIAYKSGFDNPEYFCTAFKKKTGMTPMKYREFTQGKNI